MRTSALRSFVTSPTDLENQPIKTLQARGICHYLIPTGTDFVRSTDFS